MRITKPSVEFFGPLPTDRESTVKFIEKAGRTCYKSEDKITSDSAEKFVKKLIKAGHLAMVEHSNFVVRLEPTIRNIRGWSPVWKDKIGKYLNGVYLNKRRYVGGNLTAWYQAAAQCEIPDPLFGLFIHEYSGLFDIDRQPLESAWKICPFDEVPEELHRYSAKFICDRGVSHELVRHRPCSFAQESTRYVNHAGKDMEFIEPAGFDNWPINCQKVFLGAVSTSEYIYNDAINHGLSPQQARAVLPNALKTELIVTADLAEWKHILKLRRHTSAQPDMVRVMIMLGDKFVEGGIISE